MLAKQLDDTQRHINTQTADSIAGQQMEEAMRLQQVAAMQQQEIAALRAEVRKLSRKTGYVAPPSHAKQSTVEPLPPL